MPGDSTDLSGLTGNGPEGVPHNRLGGHGSAIAYTGRGTEYALASDRGPKGLINDYACRYHRMDIRVTPGTKEPVKLKLNHFGDVFGSKSMDVRFCYSSKEEKVTKYSGNTVGAKDAAFFG